MIVIILGMHKSGTTLVSKILHQSGVNMGKFDGSIDYDHGNHYERAEMQNINTQILHCEYDLSEDVIDPVREIDAFVEVGVDIMNLSQELSGCYDTWGAKDPRTCLTYAVWNKYLPEHKTIIVYRHPEEVFWHYLKYIPRYKVVSRIVKGYKTLKSWYVYNSEILKIKNSHTICINYTEFMTTEHVLAELSDFIEAELNDCREKKMYRAKIKGGVLYSFCRLLNSLNNRDMKKLYLDLQRNS